MHSTFRRSNQPMNEGLAWIKLRDVATTKYPTDILIVGYNPAIGGMLADYLHRAGLKVSCVPDAHGLLRRVTVGELGLVLLNPDLERTKRPELLRKVHEKSSAPIILVTEQDGDETERVAGLEEGADDYVMAPLNLPELRARVRAKLRRRVMNAANRVRRRGHRYTFKGWVLDQRQRQLLSPGGENIRLSKRQFELLSAFVEAPRRILSRSDLISRTRMHDDVFDRTIDVQVLRLRRKLRDDPQAPKIIRTERGTGYIFEPEVKLC